MALSPSVKSYSRSQPPGRHSFVEVLQVCTLIPSHDLKQSKSEFVHDRDLSRKKSGDRTYDYYHFREFGSSSRNFLCKTVRQFTSVTRNQWIPFAALISFLEKLAGCVVLRQLIGMIGRY
mmetsp:Transcript_5734/g.14327  ORF Transcript_5734/g.14327 Transcript_5734/m.14327 type:complete len:120 (+) Transcript_5734:2782-3141(+)